MFSVIRFLRPACALAVNAAALLGTARLEAAELARVENLRCLQAACHERSGAIDVSGRDPALANAHLSLVVLDEAKLIVVRQPVAVQEDGSFAASISAGALTAGRYRFGVMTGTQPSRAVAGGDFTVASGSAAVQPFRADTVKPITSEPVQPVRSQTVRPVTSQSIEPVQSASVQPVAPAATFAPSPESATPRRKGFSGFMERLNNFEKQDRAAADGSPHPEQIQSSPAARPAAGGAYSVFFKTFGLAIPGVAYTTDNYATNTRTVTVASGTVTKSAVRINPDGTYIWNSAWDGRLIQGRWKPAGSGIVLMNAQSGQDWRVERLAHPAGAAEVTVWDQNSIWYNGTPLGK